MTAAPATASRGAAFRAAESPQRHDEEVALDDDASSTSSSVEALEYVRISARFDAEDAERDDEASRGADAGKDAAVAPRCPSVARASPSSRDGDDVSDGAALPDAASPPPPRTYKVRIQDMRFHPAALEIPRGAIVEWEPDRSCDVRHCLEVVDEDEEPQALSPALVPGAPWRHRFEDVGDFHYRSLVYCFMKGSVVVVDPPTPDPPVLTTTTSRSEDAVSKTAPPPRANESPADSDADSDADSAVASASVPYVALRSEDDRSDEDEDEPREAREATRGTSPRRRVAAAEKECAIPNRNDLVPRIPPPSPETFARMAALTSPSPSASADSPPSAASPSDATFCPTPVRRSSACDKCGAAFFSSTNLARHRATHRRGGKGSSSSGQKFPAKPPLATKAEIAGAWDRWGADRRRDVLDAAKPGEAAALVLANMKPSDEFGDDSGDAPLSSKNVSAPADDGGSNADGDGSRNASLSSSTTASFASYRAAGETLRAAVSSASRAALARARVARVVSGARAAGSRGGERGTWLGPGKAATDLEAMASDRDAARRWLCSWSRG